MTERWIASKTARGTSVTVDTFLQDVIDICRKHGLALAPADPRDSFEVVPLSEGVMQRLRAAADYTYKDL